jgi:glycosyltransferase involved in cell wall biosynthesis
LFVGYAEGALGLGQAFRSDLAAAAAADLSFAVFPFQVGIETRLIGPFMPERYDREHAYDINVIEVAADQAPVVFGSLDKRLTSGSYNILRTYWELPKAPEAWRPMLQNVSEIWAPNSFVGESFRGIFDGPITVIPPAVVVDEGSIPKRAHYGMEADRFYFLFSFDYFSSAHRKNPLGVLEAFRRAFPSGSEKVGLIIKSTGTVDHYPEIQKAIKAALAVDPRIRCIDTNLSRSDLLGLIRAADAYVSLHRAEGFGLGMAEAMSLGRIVIGTDYSGCTDFLSSETGFAVPYTLRPVQPHEYVWAEKQVWAEPDLDAAVAILREIAAAPERARQRAEAGRLVVKEKYGLLAVGQAMQARLAKLP